jgi:hypothetical protein
LASFIDSLLEELKSRSAPEPAGSVDLLTQRRLIATDPGLVGFELAARRRFEV